jgi:hypothetical protein
MNDETMNKDKWETFCDESYFHMWRLRRIGLHGFDDGFHINRRDEAIGLCGLLNKLERGLANMEDQRDAAIWCHEKCREDRLRVIGQRDTLAEALKGMLNVTYGQAIYSFMEPQRSAAHEALAAAKGGSNE